MTSQILKKQTKEKSDIVQQIVLLWGLISESLI